MSEIKKKYVEFIKKERKWEMDPEDVISLLTYSIGADLVEQEGEIKIGSSKFGGTPDLPESLKWPAFGDPVQALDTLELAERKEKKAHIPFIAQINTREFDHKGQLLDGMYYFFISYDIECVGGFKILFYGEDFKNLARCELPEDVEELEVSKLEFKEFYTLPILGTEVNSLNFKGEDYEIYDTLSIYDLFDEIYEPFIQILGHPVLHQRDDSLTATNERLLFLFKDEASEHSIYVLEKKDTREIEVDMEY